VFSLVDTHQGKDINTMKLTAGFLLAILSTFTQFAYSFSLKPQFSNSCRTLSCTKQLPTFPLSSSQDETHITVRGGAASATEGSGTDSSSGRKLANTVASLWAAGGFIMILGKSIKRILPIALEPFNGAAASLSTLQLASYVGMCLWFAYVEGYKGFQLKFSPLVVARAQTLKPFEKGSPIIHTILGPFYAMGLFHATKKRKIVSWSVSIGVGFIVAAVKKLPYPWRNIIDAGVIVGLTWGSVSIVAEWVKAVIMGREIKIDPALPGSESR